MDERVSQALGRDRTIDITTLGRRSRRPRRIEIWFYNVDGTVYLSGRPGSRGWYANLLATPDLTFHLKQSTTADLGARGRPVTDAAERRGILTRLLRQLGRERDLDAWLARSPLVEVEFTDDAAPDNR
ncbi:MAG: nitroreductase/quinone reductase family protein [Solirubrobacteraceae bacterium]|jgi:deazaflavin-dependent oxidoreductase (nitroreductase family)